MFDYPHVGSCKLTRWSTRCLESHTNHSIHPLYSVNLSIEHEGRRVNVQFGIVELEQENIISGDEAEELNLI